jgi:CheY-like chemotaxis protein
MSLPEFIFERVTADIRQQMAGILALTDQLARQRLTPDAQACISSVAEAAEGVRRIVTASLELNALSDNPAEPVPVRLRDLMDEIQEHWRPAAAMGAVTLLVAYDGDPDTTVTIDRSRLVRMFDGFIGEAVASARRGAVEACLAASASGEAVRLEGRIRGPLDASWATRDLEMRVREVDARFGLEVALGLIVARGILEDMGGRLREEPNRGAGQTLVFELTAARAPPSETPERRTVSRPAHVLVVDDNATNRMVAQALCEIFDCTSEAAGDGAEAVEAARGGRFDLILMDIKMPHMDGVSAARAIRSLPGRSGGVPIVALTANADPDDAAGYLAAGMDGVVEKPMKPEHLLAVLQQALAGSGAEATAA